jgi:hypothetical protein
MGPGIVNVINFIRAVEPRDPALDLVEPVRNQLRLLASHGLPGTFLLQYDALKAPRFVALLKNAPGCEIGAWLEIMRPLAERAGLAWRGRPGFDWDWHAHVGFSVGYTPREREALADVLMRDFKETFGRYPQSVGSWIIDAHTLAYLSDRYGVSGSCNCKDQWGTDGYTLWGGYFSPAYYPSRKNVFTPAGGSADRIPVPVFRMLGSDPIYQYDAGFVDERMGGNGQPVVTLEPVYPQAGGSPDWVRWFFRTTFSSPNLSFGYAQVGQENSFGWKAMAAGLEDQLALVAAKRNAGELRVECLRDTAQWFRERYPDTPASAVTALSDWQGKGRKSVWYCSRFYRLNVFQEGDRVWIRDMHLFDDRYPERYLTAPCREEALLYDNLPVMDGGRWSGGGVRAGMYPVVADSSPESALSFGPPEVRERSADELLISWPLASGGSCTLACAPRSATVSISDARLAGGWGLKLLWDARRPVPLSGHDAHRLSYRFNDWPYGLGVDGACVHADAAAGRILLAAEAEAITLRPSLDGRGPEA